MAGIVKPSPIILRRPSTALVRRFLRAGDPQACSHFVAVHALRDAAYCLSSQRSGLIFFDAVAQVFAGDQDALRMIEKADVLQCEVHKGAYRDSGEPYHFHPRAAAMNLIQEAGIKDTNMVCALLLHDVVEQKYGGASIEFLRIEFNDDIARLVDGMTKLKKEMGGETGGKREVKNLEKLIRSSADDPRVVICKLMDNLHNIRTIAGVAGKRGYETAEAIALETLRVYSPLAHILGMKKIWIELETAAYDFLDKAGMDEIRAMQQRKRGSSLSEVEKAKARLEEEIVKTVRNRYYSMGELRIDIEERAAAQLYRLRKAARKRKEDISEVELTRDLFSLRLVVGGSGESENEEMCAVVHQIAKRVYLPQPGRFQDFISLPTPGGYSALQDMLDIGMDGALRVSFLTPRAGKWADLGILSGNYRDAAVARFLLQEAGKILEEVGLEELDSRTVGKILKGLVFKIRVTTAQGESKLLPRGATARDFAYAIHTRLGHEMKGARINGELKKPGTVLSSGAQVVVIRDHDSLPGPESLREVNTPGARKRVLEFLRARPENVIEMDGEHSLAEIAAEQYLHPEDITSGPLAVEICRRIFPDINHDVPVLKRYPLIFVPEYARRRGIWDFHREQSGLLPSYFYCAIGTGTIGADRLLDEYLRLHGEVNDAASRLRELSNFIKQAQTSEYGNLFERLSAFAVKVNKISGLGLFDSIRQASKNARLEKGAEALIVSAEVIAQFLRLAATGLRKELSAQDASDIIGLALRIKQAVPTRMELVITAPDRKGLVSDISGALYRGLSMDIKDIQTVGEGPDDIGVVFSVAPESILQGTQVFRLAQRFGRVDVRDIRFESGLPPAPKRS